MKLYKKLLIILKENRRLKNEVKTLKEEVIKREIKIYNRNLINEDLRAKLRSFNHIVKKVEQDNLLISKSLTIYSDKLKTFTNGRFYKVIKITNNKFNLLSHLITEISAFISRLSIKIKIPPSGTLKTKTYSEPKSSSVDPIIDDSLFKKVQNDLKMKGEADIKTIASYEHTGLKDLVSKNLGVNHIIYSFGGKINIIPRVDALKELERTKLMLSDLKLEFSGSPCVVIGNGPSLNQHNFKYLNETFTIGANYIYLNKEKMGFLPNVISATNYLVVEQRMKDFLDLDTKVLLPLYMMKKVGRQKNIYYVNINHENAFSENINEWASTRSTVTYFNLQLAYSLGFKETFLIGVDNTYTQSVKGEGKVLNQKEDDTNHFAKEYFRGLKWQSADTDKMEGVYRKAKAVFQVNNRLIFNAGIGGNLSCFERIDYKKITKRRSQPIKYETREQNNIYISINPDLCSKFGHYLQFDKCWSDELTIKNKSLFCLCNKEIEFLVNTRYGRLLPCFSQKSHEVGMRDYGDGSKTKDFLSELKGGVELIKEIVPSKNAHFRFFMYCGSFQHLIAIKELAKTNQKYKFYINVFFPSFERYFGRNSDALGVNVLADVNEINNITLLFGTVTFRDYFQKRFNVRGKLLPYSPTTPISLLKRKMSNNSTKYITLLGNMRPEKGKDFSLDTIAKILDDADLVQFKLRLRKPRSVDTREAVEALDLISEERIEWIEGDVDIYEFAEFVKHSHINIITYDKDAFEMRPSGVFADSIIGEVPVLVPDETDMARTVNRFGNGETFLDGDLESLVKCVKLIVKYPEQYREGVIAVRKFWEKENSWKNFVRILEN